MRRPPCFVAALAVLVLCAGCLEEPGRTNPFDPQSEAFVEVGSVEGRVLDGAEQPLARVSVSLEATAPDASAGGTGLRLSTRTGTAGRFAFEEVPAGRYAFEVLREDYAVSVRDTVEVETGRLLDVGTVQVNAPPVFIDVAYDAVHERGWSVDPGDSYSLEVRAVVDDPEESVEGVDAVWLEVPALNFVDTLRAVRLGEYVGAVHESRLPGGRMHALIGRTMRLKARDDSGVVGSTAPLVLERVIDAVPAPTAPDSFDVVTDPTPRLRWQALSLPFPFTYQATVSRMQEDVTVPVWHRSEMSATASAVTPGDALAPGTYVWTVTAVDEFGNRSRSRPAGFRIVE